MHLKIGFAGSGMHAWDYLYSGKNTLVVHGCKHPEVCNSTVFPNLRRFAKRFTESVFSLDGQTLRLATGNPQYFGVGIGRLSLKKNGDRKIRSITLYGYSRGGVTCFEVARQLFQLAPHIPVNIIADQPVPGSLFPGLNTNAGSIIDCRTLTNLKNVTLILATYAPTNFFMRIFFRLFFSQVVPNLSPEIKREILVVPKIEHYPASSLVEICLARAELNALKDDHAIAEGKKSRKSDLLQRHIEDSIKRHHKSYIHKQLSHPSYIAPLYLASRSILGRFFGIRKSWAYQYTDPHHPTPYLRETFQWGKEKLIDWWKNQEKKASLFSTQPTKKLAKKIEAFSQSHPKNNADALKKLFKRADKWVISKAGHTSSRHCQVEALRNNLFHRLTTEMKVSEADLAKTHTALLEKKNYFLNYWHHTSTQASFFKTSATRDLDKAFVEHSEKSIDGAALIERLNHWLDVKKESPSKRYELVMHIRDQLEKVTQTSSEKMVFTP